MAVCRVIGALEVEVGQALVEGLHAVLGLAGLHHAVDLVDLVLADQVADRRVRHAGSPCAQRPSLAAGPRQQRLAEDALEHERQLGADLRLLVGGEDVDDAVDRLRRRVGVQGGEGQVAGLGDAQRRLDRLQVAHLADQHDVRVLAQHRAQGVGEAVGVGAELALVDDALLVRVQVLDRVLDGDDVLVTLAVDLVEHRRQRRRLARAGRAGDQDQPARLLAQLLRPTTGRPSSRKLRIS